MASLPLTNPSQAGTLEAFSAASAGGDSFPFPKTIIIRIKNAAGAGRTITIVAQGVCSYGVAGSPAHDAVIVTANATTTEVTVPDSPRYRDANGRIQLTYSSEVGVSVSAHSA